MKKRQRIPMSKSKRSFSKTAQKTHPKNNTVAMPMRGGIRL